MSEDTTQLVMLIVFIATVGLLLWQQYKTGKTITVNDVAAAVQAAQPIIDRVRVVAEGVVLAIEQIKRDGKLTNEQAFQKAFAELRKQFPITSGVTDAEILREINRAVLIGSNMSAQIKAAKTVTEAVDTGLPESQL